VTLTPEETGVVNLNILVKVLICFEEVMFWAEGEDNIIVFLFCETVTLFLETLVPGLVWKSAKSVLVILTPEDTLVVNLNISDDVLVCFEKVVFWTVSEDFIVLLLCKAVTLFLETLAPLKDRLSNVVPRRFSTGDEDLVWLCDDKSKPS